MHELKIYRGVMYDDNKNDAKFEEELTCRFKIDIRNLTNFDANNQTFSKIFTLMDSF